MTKNTLALALAAALILPATASARDLVVPDQFPTIQAAINAATSGDKIYVDDGLFVEQLKVEGKEVQILGGLATLIQAPAGARGGVVSVTGGGVLGLYDVMIDGGGAGDKDGFYGVYVKGGDATLENVIVSGMSPASCRSCQTGLGAFVEAGPGEQSTLTATRTVFKEYQKGGLLAKGAGTMVFLEDSSFIGSGPNPYIVQNGIQISDGAGGLIQACYVKDHRYVGPTWGAAGIVLRDASDIEIHQNISQRNQVGIYNLTPEKGWADTVSFSKRHTRSDEIPVVARRQAPTQGVQIHNNHEFAE